jgi:hypothetical protein
MYLLYSLTLGAPIWPIGVGGPRVRPVRAHSSYATGTLPSTESLFAKKLAYITSTSPAYF